MDSMEDISDEQWQKELSSCCVSTRWVEQMLLARPFADEEILYEQAETIWFNLDEEDWLEAFDGHPKIGDVASLQKKYRYTAEQASSEQASVELATDETIEELALYNEKYFKKFGFIFIVFATGKSAQQMLELLKERLENDPLTELQNAAVEQNEITKLRLEKLL